MVRTIIALLVTSVISISANAKPNYQVDPQGETIFILQDQIAHTSPKGKIICLRKVKFMSFRKGLVFCGHRSGDAVYKLKPGTSTIPENMYFTLEELKN